MGANAPWDGMFFLQISEGAYFIFTGIMAKPLVLNKNVANKKVV